MSKNLGAKPMLVPQPVMMIGTYDADGNANVMNNEHVLMKYSFRKRGEQHVSFKRKL